MQYTAKMGLLNSLTVSALSELRGEISALIEAAAGQTLDLQALSSIAQARVDLSKVDSELGVRNAAEAAAAAAAEAAATSAAEAAAAAATAAATAEASAAETAAEAEAMASLTAQLAELSAENEKLRSVNFNRGVQSDITGASGSSETLTLGQLVAGSDVPGTSAGMPFASLEAAARGLMAKAASMAEGDRASIMTLNGEYTTNRILDLNEAANMEKIAEATGGADRKSLTASGGFCAIYDAYRGQAVLAQANKPVTDSLPMFQADNAGVRWIPGPKFANAAGAITSVTDAEDRGSAGPPVVAPKTKNCLVTTCDSEGSEVLQALAECLTVGNFMARSNPARVVAWLQLAAAQHARAQEQLLLDKISAYSTPVAAAATYGATRTAFPTIDKVVAGYRSRNRIADQVNLRAQMPFWTRDVIKADLARGWEQRLEVTDGQVDEWFRMRHINPNYYLDTPTGRAQIFPTQTANAQVVGFPAMANWLIYPEGSMIGMDGGTLNIGVQRDRSGNQANEFQIFTENWINLFNPTGFDALSLVISLIPNGTYPLGVAPAV